MATVKSENVTAIEGSEDLGLHRKRGRIKTVIDQRAVASGEVGDANDLILLGPIPSNAVILDVLVANDDLDAHACPTLAVDVGLAYSGIGGTQKLNGNTSGTAVDVDCFASAATTLQAANVTWQSLRFEADDIVDVKKEAWSVGGLSADPGGLLFISVKVTTAAATDAAGDLVVRVDYI